MKMDFRHADRADTQKLNVILWKDAMGSKPVPAMLMQKRQTRRRMMTISWRSSCILNYSTNLGRNRDLGTRSTFRTPSVYGYMRQNVVPSGELCRFGIVEIFLRLPAQFRPRRWLGARASAEAGKRVFMLATQEEPANPVAANDHIQIALIGAGGRAWAIRALRCRCRA